MSAVGRPSQEHPETMRACVEMAKAWRMDKYLRRLEAVMIVVDADVSLQLTGTGDVFDTDDGVIGIGSGGAFATAAANALLDVDGYDAEMIGRKVCVRLRVRVRVRRRVRATPNPTPNPTPPNPSPHPKPKPSPNPNQAMDIAADMCVYTNKNYVLGLGLGLG